MPQEGSSSKARKQRKRHFQAPKHVIHRQFTVPVSGAEAKYPNIQRATVRKGDRVVIDRGQGAAGNYTDKDTKVKDVQGKVSRVDYKRRLVFIEDLKMRKRGNKVADRPVDPRNITILAFDVTDKRRKETLDKMNARGQA
jgi:ribosomal protein uL24